MSEGSAFDGALRELAFAYENVPFFREHLNGAGIRPADISSLEEWRQVPATVKADYRLNFPAGVLARGKTLAEPRVLKSQSSGTGGDRLTTVAHTYSLAARMQATLSVNAPLRTALANCRHHRPARYAAPNCSDVDCATPFSTVKDRTLPDGTLVLPVAHDLLATPQYMVRQAMDELREFRPDWLYVDPTHLAFLLREVAQLRERPPEVQAIVLTYTLATGVARRQISEHYGDVPMSQIVSMTELGWVAGECPHGNMHVNSRTFLPEFLVGDQPARPGELAELVMTSIGDRLCPHIRYRTGDVYRLGADDCPCDSAFPVARHEGRFQNMIWKPDGRWVTAREIDDCVGRNPGIELYQARQLTDGSVSFSYIPVGPSAAAEVRDLEERLRDLFGTGLRLTVTSTDYISAQRSGKFASCVGELSQAKVDAGSEQEIINGLIATNTQRLAHIPR
ncbi:phenylacetate--CoA ligase family protein [Streptosporangium algeriense]|uniref:Phenylacetate--CoA ligase family protein n=1 Tax=Streptosporangium algeriense TaxID=1682748 RepID=A0ABW3DL58_9ACTN